MEDLCPEQQGTINLSRLRQDNYYVDIINKERPFRSYEGKYSFEASYTAEAFPNEQDLAKSPLKPRQLSLVLAFLKPVDHL